MIDLALAALNAFAAAHGLIITLVVMIGFDILMGLAAATGMKTLNSTTSWRGMSRKAATLIIVGMAMALEPHVNLGLEKIVCLFYIVTEALSILENAALLGLPVPQVVVDLLYKLREPSRKENARLERGEEPRGVL